MVWDNRIHQRQLYDCAYRTTQYFRYYNYGHIGPHKYVAIVYSNNMTPNTAIIVFQSKSML